MKKVCFFNYPEIKSLPGYHIDTLDPIQYFGNNSKWGLVDLLRDGWSGYSKLRSIKTAEGLDKLYRSRDPAYMKFLTDFVNKYNDYDAIIMTSYNCVHPDVLYHELKKPVKIIAFVDDPYSTYTRSQPYLWAFDGAYYISPSYSNDSMFKNALERWGCKQNMWWPWVPDKIEYPEVGDEFFSNRDIDLIYVGNPTGTKLDRIIKLKKHFRSRLRVHGRWRFKGYVGLMGAMFGKPVYWHRVTPISEQDRAHLYYNTKIGINMHVSDTPTETGNMRMYEIPAHGMMMMCDKAALNAHESIYQPDNEAVFYDTIDDAIEKIEFYLKNDDKRIEIAKNGFVRMWNDYEWEKNFLKLLDWAVSLKQRD